MLKDKYCCPNEDSEVTPFPILLDFVENSKLSS